MLLTPSPAPAASLALLPGFFLFPALLFNGLMKTRIDWTAAGPLLTVVMAMGAMVAGIALGLLAVGAGLRIGKAKVGAGETAAAYLLAVKLAAMPLATLGLIRWIGLAGVYADVALVLSALPTASSAFILAQRMGGDGARVAWLTSVGTVLGMPSLPFWISVR